MTEPVKLELVLPESVQGLLRMETLTVPADRAEVVVKIMAASDARLTGEQSLTIRATAIQPGNLRVVSEATVPFVVGK